MPEFHDKTPSTSQAPNSEGASLYELHVESLREEIETSKRFVETDRSVAKPDGSSPQLAYLRDAIDDLSQYVPAAEDVEPFSLLTEDPPKNIKAETTPDIALPMYAVAKKARTNPMELASSVATNASDAAFDSVEALGPYANIRVSDHLINEGMGDILRLGADFGKSNDHEGEVAVIDYSSPNVAKPFGINHLRSTVIGESLSRIFAASGYTVVRDNHLGDWGTQFGNLLAAYDASGSDKPFEELTIDELNTLYVGFNTEKANSPNLVRNGRKAFKALNDQDPASLARWAAVVSKSREDFDRIYERLGITFDTQIGESYFAKPTEALVEQLAKEYPDVIRSDSDTNAIYTDAGKHPVVLRTADGYCVYAARDLATIDFRNKTYRPDTMLYVIGDGQASAFESVFKVAQQVGLVGENDQGVNQTLEYISFGMLLDDDGKKLSTRSGTSGKLESLIDSVTERAAEEVGNHNPELSREELTRIAGKIAIGAIVWNDLKNDRTTSVKFDMDRMLELGSEKVIDILFSYHRSRAVLENAGYDEVGAELIDLDSPLLTQAEHTLGYSLCEFPDVVRKALNERAPHHIATYLHNLESQYGSFYQTARLKGESDVALQQNRAAMHKAYMVVIKNGLDLLNISIPEKM